MDKKHNNKKSMQGLVCAIHRSVSRAEYQPTQCGELTRNTSQEEKMKGASNLVLEKDNPMQNLQYSCVDLQSPKSEGSSTLPAFTFKGSLTFKASFETLILNIIYTRKHIKK